MNRPVVVIIATKDRPNEVSNLLDTLALQTVPPDMIIVSACEQSDIDESCIGASNVTVLFGSRGLTAQRNRALPLVEGKYDIIVFFDDDFIPSRFWIERAEKLLATEPDVVCVTGKVLLDGATFGGLEWSEGRALVDRADASKKAPINEYKIKDRHSPYGCNMAFRAKVVEHLAFDERLALYGWLEDRDFSFRAGPRMIWTDAVWGVHLGATRGRPSGVSFGYSQVANPLYLARKGTMTSSGASQAVLRALAANVLGSLSSSSHIDRWGRLKGNMMAIKDIVLGRCAPERVAEL
jgi:glycosyltransferase involved in cell wall biosynthesis